MTLGDLKRCLLIFFNTTRLHHIMAVKDVNLFDQMCNTLIKESKSGNSTSNSWYLVYRFIHILLLPYIPSCSCAIRLRLSCVIFLSENNIYFITFMLCL